MNTLNNIVDKHLNELLTEIIEKYKSKGMKASGEFERDSYAETKGLESVNGVIWGTDYSTQLEEGRDPTSGSGDGTLLQKITQWVKDKNISPKSGTLLQMIHAITNKIHRDGWDRKGYGGVNLFSEVLTDVRIEKLFDDILADYQIIVETNVEKRFKELV